MRIFYLFFRKTQCVGKIEGVGAVFPPSANFRANHQKFPKNPGFS